MAPGTGIFHENVSVLEDVPYEAKLIEIPPLTSRRIPRGVRSL
jgi:hypothetical protein